MILLFVEVKEWRKTILFDVCHTFRIWLRNLFKVKGVFNPGSTAMDFDTDESLKEWAKDKPLSILQLDPADRAVLRIAGMFPFWLILFQFLRILW